MLNDGESEVLIEYSVKIEEYFINVITVNVFAHCPYGSTGCSLFRGYLRSFHWGCGRR